MKYNVSEYHCMEYNIYLITDIAAKERTRKKVDWHNNTTYI